LNVRTSLNKEGSSLTLFASNIKARRYCLEEIIRQFFQAILDGLTDPLVQKADENVREHQLRIIERALEKEKRKVSIKEVAGMSGLFGFGRGSGAPSTATATNSPYFRILRQESSAAARGR
jgi:hypothetical protein